ncbi:G-protein coupled receptor 161-like [Porites lutea]|uniref:G-protein coupled receptor 161-like n=1 Tax=Porites lutea TaxID=51062 RepID=UPI003CC60668
MTLSILVTISEVTILCFICLTAFIGNVSLFLTVYKNPNLRTITNMFILNLAAADILVSVLSMPVTMVTIVKEHWVFGHTACVVLGYFTILSFIASVMSLGMIAINRYFYIVKWNTYTINFTKTKALLYAAGVWFVSMSLASPPLFGWAEYRFIPGKSYCFVYWPSNVYFMYFMITVCFFGPLSVMAFSYYNILNFTKNIRIKVSRNNLTPKPRQLETQGANEMQNEVVETMENKSPLTRFNSHPSVQSKSQKPRLTPEEQQMTNTFLLVLALFIICWAPFAITMFFDVYYPQPLPRPIDTISLLLGYLNSMCNPVLYGMRNSAFKQGFVNLYSWFIPERFRHRYSGHKVGPQMKTNPRSQDAEETS